MTTWNEIKKYLRLTYNIAREDEDHVFIVFGVGEHRTQQIVLSRFIAINREFIEFRTPVCRVGQMDAMQALEWNCQSSVGALGVEGGVYFLIHNALISTLDPAELEIPLKALAAVADSLESRHTRGRDEF